ncbi:MAG TPA: TonB-dependent receptor [Steroidobacteraceae bacterium]|nr:TonB-dependent receptor [Steroidobacteraceae bacterium]
MFQCVHALSKRLFFAAAIAATSMPALSQQAPTAAATPDTTLEEVIVTGSRIAAPNEVSTSPIQVLSSKYIETSGKTDIGDLITQLPQNFNNSLGQDLGNGTSGLTTAGGVSTADLRGLGPNRTLVLVDGRRLGQGSPYTFIQSPAPDLDQIPAGLVERVEVVTGGASAAYGSDAIAGVINFIMKKNFEGVQVDGQFNENLHSNGNSYLQGLVRGFNASVPATGTNEDGRQRNFDVLMGTNFADGKGNITGFLSYRHADPVASSQRDFGGCQLFPTTDTNGNVTGTSCGGSSNSNFINPATGPNAGTQYSVFGSGFVPRGSVLTTPPASFNSQQYIYMTREDDRYNGAFLAHDDVADYFQPYAELYFMDDKTHQQIAPAALFRGSDPNDPFNAGNYNVNCDNPLLSGQQRGILCSPTQLAYVAANPGKACIYNTAADGTVSSPNCANVEIGRRNIEGGGRLSDFEHENYRAVLGTKGKFLDDAWSYDLYGQYYYTTFFNSNRKYLNFANIDKALQVTGTAANPVCISGGSCVPYNMWSDGGVTQAALNYLYLTGTGQGSSTLRTVHAEVTGQLGKYGITSPLANDGIGVNIGFEHRNDHEFFSPDSAEQSGQLSGFGSAAVPIDNSLSVKEAFTEVRAPLIQDKPFAKELLFDTGFRYSDYSTNVKTHTYKFEVQYAPIADYRLRASYDKAIRAPSVVELYNPQLVGLIQFGNDPCAPPITFTLAQCERTGVTAAQYAAGSIPQGAAGQLSQVTGGNPALKPEQAETYTFGVNFAPGQVPGLTGSIDYFHIAIRDEVTTIPAAVILNNCANTGDPTYCSQIVRERNGSLNGNSFASGGYFIQTNVNAGAALVSGIDLQTSYKFDLPPNWGSIALEMNGAYLQHAESTPLPGQHTYDCAGLFGFTCQTINPRWHHIFRTTWMTPWDVSGSITWRYIGKVSQDNNSGDPTLHFATWGAYDYFNASIPSYSYLDLEATWHVNKILTLRAGANNVLDKDPPVINSQLVSGGAANTYDIYDMFGTQLFVAFTAKF